MKKLLLIASTTLLAASGFAVAGDHPSFTEADTDSNGELNTQELTTALPTLQLQGASASVTAADVKQALPEVEFTEEDVANAEPIGEEQYQKIVDAMDDMESTNTVGAIQ
ncbi:MAG: hypothetical protein RKH07_06040 [Gammaproteobacteria bacterium]